MSAAVDGLARGAQCASDDNPGASAEAEPKIYGVVPGTVINVLDPLFLGRVQVQVPAIDALIPGAWARVATPAASLLSGFYWIPNVEDEVLVAFEQGDINAPYVIGCLWSAIVQPPMPTPVPQIHKLRTLLGNEIVLADIPPSISLLTPGGIQIRVGPTVPQAPPTAIPETIQIMFGTSLINIGPEGIMIHGTPSINLVADAAITITAPNVSVMGTAATTIGSPASPCVVAGTPVAIN
jgi:hypothetical protein